MDVPTTDTESIASTAADQEGAQPGNDQQWITEFAKRHHRLHHVLWHSLRHRWPLLSETQKTTIQRLGWAPPRVAVEYTNRVSSRPAISNGSGEDFLFMHREMIDLYRKHGGRANNDWVVPPQPGTAGGTPPPAWKIPERLAFDRRMRALKGDGHYWSRMLWWDREFKDPTRLRTLTLGELGSLLEYSIHNDMHMRWASQPRDPQTGALLTTGRPSGDISVKWDDPKYDYLGEFYSSHVHPDFWRLHGWVDARINDWFAAHLAAGNQVRRRELNGVRWFEGAPWVFVKTPWSSGPHHVSVMEQVFRVMYPPVADGMVATEADPLAATVGALL